VYTVAVNNTRRNNTETKTTWAVIRIDGRTYARDSLEGAVAELRAEYPDLVTHTDPGRTLVWRSEAESENDPGARAIAEIRKVASH
jgi:hypothetical protein